MKPLLLPFAILSAVFFALIPSINPQAADMHTSLEDTEWQLVSFGEDSPTLPGTSITLIFEEDNQFGGSGGCNSYGGTYEVNGDTINFGEIASTLMACLDDGVMEQEQAFLDALQSATGYESTGTQLVITNGEEVLLVFTPLNTLINTEWQLVSYGLTGNETTVMGETPITLQFSDENQFTGFSGCNDYGGMYHAMNETLTFQEIFSTRVACTDETVMALEQLYFAALETTTGYRVSENQLIIFYGTGEQLTFTQINTLHDSQWQLVSYGVEQAVVPESVVLLEFGDNEQFVGIGGCNNYSGRYETQNDTITFSAVLSTRRACADVTVMEQEQAYFLALESATRYELSGDQLIIEYTTENGDDQQLVFIRVSINTHIQ